MSRPSTFISTPASNLFTSSSTFQVLETTVNADPATVSNISPTKMLDTSRSYRSTASLPTRSNAQSQTFKSKPESITSAIVTLETIHPLTVTENSYSLTSPAMSESPSQAVDTASLAPSVSWDGETHTRRTWTVTITTCSRRSVLTAPWNRTLHSPQAHTGSFLYVTTPVTLGLQPSDLSSPGQRTSIQPRSGTTQHSHGSGATTVSVPLVVPDTTRDLAIPLLAARSIDLDDSLRPHWSDHHDQGHAWQFYDLESSTCTEFLSTMTKPLSKPVDPISYHASSSGRTLTGASGTSSAISVLVSPSPSTITASATTISAVHSESIDDSASRRGTDSTVESTSSKITGSDADISSISSLLVTSTTAHSPVLTSVLGSSSLPSDSTAAISREASRTDQTTSTSVVDLPVQSSSSIDITSAVQTTALSKSSACLAIRAVAPAPTQTGIIAGCSLYYVAQAGDDCIYIAGKFDISANDFITWNPAVGADCSRLRPNDAYCVEVCGSVTPSIVFASTLTATTTSLDTLSSVITKANTSPTTAISTSTTALTSTDSLTFTAALPTGTASGVDVYQTYTGNGSVAAGWPSMDQWVSFDYMYVCDG
nr:hypothetical protein CFP56_57650 [Quercus suber]